MDDTPPLLIYYYNINVFQEQVEQKLKETLKNIGCKLKINLGIYLPEIKNNFEEKVKDQVLKGLREVLKSIIGKLQQFYHISIVGRLQDSDVDLWIYYFFDDYELNELLKEYQKVNINGKSKIFILTYLFDEKNIRKIQEHLSSKLLQKIEVINLSSGRANLLVSAESLRDCLYNELCASSGNIEVLLRYFLISIILKSIKEKRKKKVEIKNIIEDINKLHFPRKYTGACGDEVLGVLFFKLLDFLKTLDLVKVDKNYYTLTPHGEVYLDQLASAFDDFCKVFPEHKEIWVYVKDMRLSVRERSFKSSKRGKRVKENLENLSLNSASSRRADLKERDVCPECGNNFLITDSATGEVACPSCGYVVVERGLDRKPEWTKDEDEARMKAGPPLSVMFHDYGLSTTIDKIDMDATGRRLPKEARESLFRLKKLDSATLTDPTEARNIQQASHILETYVDRLHLGRQVAEEAMAIYRKAFRKGLVRGRSIEAVVAGSLYTACRLMNVPRDLREFEIAYPRVRRGAVAQIYKLLVWSLGIKVPAQDPSIFVRKIASKLGLSQKTVQEAWRILEEARGKGLVTGKDPVGMAAAALYIACDGLEVTKKDLARASGVTEITIRNRSKELRDALYQEALSRT